MAVSTGARTLGAALRPTRTGRPVAYGSAGMVASQSSAAAAVGIEVLRTGGNAFDAAVAAALVDDVTRPSACGTGGDCFVVAHEARTGRVWALNGSGIAPRALTPEWLRAHGHAAMPQYGALAVGIPGAVDVYRVLLERFGTRPFDALVGPSIDLAERGIVVTPEIHRMIGSTRPRLSASEPSAATFLPGGAPLPIGAPLRRPDLGRTLRHLAEHGPRAFYEGPLAARLVAAIRRQGGLFTEDEFAAHRTELDEPIRTSYRGLEVHENRPPSQGFIVLEMLNLLEPEDLAALPAAEATHLMVEAKKLAFADRLAHVADRPDGDGRLARLISKGFARLRRADLSRERASERVPGAARELVDGDTSYLCVADAAGNAVSLIHSVCNGFGGGMIADDTGVLLNNRAGFGFTLDPDDPNRLEGGKRTMHTLNCYLLTRDGQPVLVGGTPGGDGQPQWNVQVLTALIDLGFDVQEAAEMPRWFSLPAAEPRTLDNPFELRLDPGVPDDLAAGLAERGHRLVRLAEPSNGYVQLVGIDRERGVLTGGTDPRTPGIAIGW